MTFGTEFQAVVLAAGKGTRMSEITAGKPKCLLPVGPKPLVWYPLFKLQETGFTDAIMVVFENQKQEIQTTLDRTDLKIRIEYFTVPSTEDLGTADSLRLLNDKIKSDVVVVSCDLITDFYLYKILNQFRMHRASVLSLFFKAQSEVPVVPGPKQKHKPERDFIAVDNQTSRLIMFASASDFEEVVAIPDRLMEKHFDMVVRTNILDSYLYVLRHWIIKYLQHNTSISTIKGELLPHIVSKQHPPPKAPTKDTNASMVAPAESNDIYHFAKEDDLQIEVMRTSAYMDHHGDMEPCYHGDAIRCYAYIAPPAVFGIRVNTLPAYWSINGKILSLWERVTHKKELQLIDPKATVKSTQIDDKCLVWDSANLCEKTSFKNSVIGTNSEVNSFSRVFNSIVMNNVVIKERVALENCIVCDGAKIESGTKLMGCLVGSHHVVPEQSQHTNEVLTDVSRLMEF